MKYIIRAVKYFLYVSVIASAILGILAATGFISSDINVMFKNGWKSVGQILLMFACVSAFYPRLGYCKRLATVLGDQSALMNDVVKYMEDRGFSLESRTDDVLTFRTKSAVQKFLRVYEDRITVEKALGGFYVEGLTKEVARIVSGLEFKFRNLD